MQKTREKRTAWDKAIVDRLRELRDKKRLSQREVATRIGATLAQYQKWEDREKPPPPYWLVKLAVYHRVPIWWLLTDEPTEHHLHAPREVELQPVGRSIRRRA